MSSRLGMDDSLLLLFVGVLKWFDADSYSLSLSSPFNTNLRTTFGFVPWSTLVSSFGSRVSPCLADHAPVPGPLLVN